MKFSSINIEGNILSIDLLSKIEDGSEKSGQAPSDFGLDTGEKVSDDIQRAWGFALDQWKVFKERREQLDETDYGTTLVRRFWIEPLLDVLGYNPEYERKAEEVMNRLYPISHRDFQRDRFPIHIVGFQDKALDAPDRRSTLDVKPSSGTSRMSPHAMVQEYLNLTEHLYAIVTNGLQLRVLRDSSRLVKLSFIEFNLEQMMEEGHFSDFRLLFRLVHASRMPKKETSGAESLIESFHQESLISGESIRDGLGDAVEESILQLANGFLQHPQNKELRELVESGELSARELYRYILRLIYRLLFLMVIEERNLVFGKEIDSIKRNIYYDFYSVNRLRKLAESTLHADKRFTDYWEALKNTFKLFENDYYGSKLGISPLGGDLFGANGIGYLQNCTLNNETLLQSLKRLGLFHHKETKQLIRVNYANLNVEEFGSVYEGLLEYEPLLTKNGRWVFEFGQGEERSKTGSHYTPDDLVQPLIKHSLDHLIQERKENPGKFVSDFGINSVKDHIEKALLDLKIADVACGSGHILLSAARRIGLELARIRTGEDQPSPEAMRKAIRDSINHCIYGVDKNPMAVELCKVALWLEAHNPGEPLNFLDHQIKCGDAIIGMAHFDELLNGVPDEAFKRTEEDINIVASSMLSENKKQRKANGQLSLPTSSDVVKEMEGILSSIEQISVMPEQTSEQIENKTKAYKTFVDSEAYWHLKTLADIPVAQFFIPKDQSNKERLITQKRYQQFLTGNEALKGEAVAMAQGVAANERFFHWFLEFPDVLRKGGFDCILGNPPYLGDRKLKAAFGEQFLEWVRYYYTPGSTVDLVVYFLKRIFSIIKSSGFLSIISTNTVAQGKAREEGVLKIINQGGSINYAVKSMIWPGKATVEVSILSIVKGEWEKPYYLNNRKTISITSYLDDARVTGDPFPLNLNLDKSFQGTIVLGTGFILEQEEADKLLAKNPKNVDVVQSYLNGSDLNSNPDQMASRYVINFNDWPLRRFSTEEWDELDKGEKKKIVDRVSKDKIVTFAPPYYKKSVAEDYPDCIKIVRERVKPERTRWKKDKDGNEIVGKFQLRGTLPKYWWRFAETRPQLYKKVSELNFVIASSRVSKYVLNSIVQPDPVFDVALNVITSNEYELFSMLQSRIHQEWAWKYASTMESRVRYTNVNCIDTFPFPKTNIESLKKLGFELFKFRSYIQTSYKIGLTDLYNLFHSQKLTTIQNENDFDDKQLNDIIGRQGRLFRSKLDDVGNFNAAVKHIFELRKRHTEIDKELLAVYGWSDIDLNYNFYEQDYLTENDNIRFTIHPDAKREILERLLELNHSIFEDEAKKGLHKKKDVEAFYKQKGESIPGDVEFSDKKRTKKTVKSVKKETKLKGLTLFDIANREETMKPYTIDDGIYSITDAQEIINSVLKDEKKKVTNNQVRNWFKDLAESGYRGIKDSVDKDIDDLRISFHGLIELYVIGKLSVNGFRLRDILTARGNLVEKTGKVYPFASDEINKSLKVHGRSIDFDYPGVGVITLDGTSQFNMDIIDEFFRDIKFENGMASRIMPKKGNGKIVIDPAICAGHLAVESKKIEVESILGLLDGGESEESIISNFGLTNEDLEAAMNFMN